MSGAGGRDGETVLRSAQEESFRSSRAAMERSGASKCVDGGLEGVRSRCGSLNGMGSKALGGGRSCVLGARGSVLVQVTASVCR